MAYSLSKKNPGIGLFYGSALQMNGQPLQAYNLEKELLLLYPDDLPVKFSLATLETSIQKYDESIAILEPLIKTPPPSLAGKDNRELLWPLGKCYLYKGDYTKAIGAFQGALNQIPFNVPVLAALGETYLKVGDLENARVTLDKALDLNPNAERALFYKGLVLEKTGDVKAAQANYQKAYSILKQYLDKDGQNGEDYYLMFLICQKLSKNEEGAKYKAEAAQLLYTYEAPWKG